MKYTPPRDSEDSNAPFVDADPANGQQGSEIPAGALENPQREIVTAIKKMGMEPSENTDQLGTALYEAATTSDFVVEDKSSTGTAYILKPKGQVTYSKLEDGQRIRFIVSHANEGAATINAYGTGAISAKKYAGTAALSSGDLLVGAVVNLPITHPETFGNLLQHHTKPQALPIMTLSSKLCPSW